MLPASFEHNPEPGAFMTGASLSLLVAVLRKVSFCCNYSTFEDLLSEFMGAKDTFANWQLELCTMYNLGDKNICILISMKLKKKVLVSFEARTFGDVGECYMKRMAI